ncbi:hypothetical protein D3C76_737550 [compost metagenome]
MGRLCLADTTGPDQQEHAHRCFVISEARSGGAQPLGKCKQRGVLTNNTLGQLIFQVQQAGMFVLQQAAERHARPVGDHFSHTAGAHVE